MPASPAIGMSFTAPGLGSQSVLSPASGGLQYSLEVAGRGLERHLAADSQFPGLADRLKVTQHGCPTVSGLHEADYPSLSLPGQRPVSLKQLSTARKAPLPAELVEHFGHLQCNCMMGLFPELGRAWLTIDNDIYVWLFETGADLAYYDGLSETILCVGLARPRPGVFQPHIQHVLCLATPLELVLLGVTFGRPREPGGPPEMHLLPEPLFSIPTDGAYITAMASSPTGRIFLGARDGCLYEIVYQASDSWFSRRCRKINHSSSTLSFLVPAFVSAVLSQEDALLQLCVDASRGVLYTRSERGTVQVYDLGADGQLTARVAALSLFSIVQTAAAIARTVDQNNFKPIIDISPISAAESSLIHLVATSRSGVRLYFSTSPLGGAAGPARPSTLQLVHVRLPPGFAANAPPQRPSALHMARCSAGTSVLVSAPTEELDVLWLLSSDPLPASHQLTELQSTLALDGHSWALHALPEQVHLGGEPGGGPQPPLVVTQHARRPRRLVALSARGVQILQQLRPVDQLRALLEDTGGPDTDPVRAFFSLHTETQACAAALILACSDAPQDAQVAEWAARAFFLYGGEPRTAPGTGPVGLTGSPATPQTSALMSSSFQPQQMSTPLPGHSPVYSPYQTPQHPPAAPAGPAEQLQYSARHEALYLYVSRLLRPLWAGRAVREFSPQPGTVHLVSAFSAEELGWLAGQLELVSRFLQRHSQLAAPLYGDAVSTQQLQQRLNSFLQPDGQPQQRAQLQAQSAERQSLHHLAQFVTYVKQVVGLMKVVTDHQTHVVTEALSKENQSSLRLMTFRDLALAGQDMCYQLISALVGRYLGDNASTEAISARLCEVCPTLYRAEDAVSARASEMLISARGAGSKQERERLLKEALTLAKQVAGQINLSVVSQHFLAVQHYEGVVELALAAASKRDPQGLALHYYRAGEPPEDTQGRDAYIARSECYNAVLDMLSTLHGRASSGVRQSPVPARPGPPPPADPASQPQLAQRQFQLVLDRALRSDDELMHVALYSWMSANNMADRLLQVNSPYVEPYLRRASTSSPSLQTLDLLWKHHERNSNYLAAAKVLAKLAERHGTDVSLTQRIEYLARAILCIKTGQMQVSAAAQGEFLYELEEKMEVARVQVQVLETLRGRSPEAESRLNADLLDLTSLYQLCEQHELHRCKLAILVCAGHRDAALVRSLWVSLLQAEPDPGAVTELARSYRQQPAYFPLEVIVHTLEVQSCRQREREVGWVVSALSEAGVPVTELLSVYQSLYRQADLVWSEQGRPLHLLQVIAHLVATFADNPHIVPARERRAFTSTCLDLIAAYVNDLNASSEAGAGVLVAQLKASQAKLERLRP